MKIRRIEWVIVTVVAICLGTGMHFVHHVPFFNHFLGYIFPVNECVWEHMKMLFYPMLLTSIYMCVRERSVKPFGGMIAANLVCIPVQIALFFVYFVFTGHAITIVDVIAYLVVMIFGYWLGPKFASKEVVRRNWPAFVAVAVAMIVIIAVLTYHYPDIILFDPGLE